MRPEGKSCSTNPFKVTRKWMNEKQTNSGPIVISRQKQSHGKHSSTAAKPYFNLATFYL